MQILFCRAGGKTDWFNQGRPWFNDWRKGVLTTIYKSYNYNNSINTADALLLYMAKVGGAIILKVSEQF